MIPYLFIADSALNHTLLQVMSFIPEIILSGHPGICSLITGKYKRCVGQKLKTETGKCTSEISKELKGKMSHLS